MSWKTMRLWVFAIVGAALLAVGAIVKWLKVEHAPETLLELFGMVGIVMGLLVVGDVVYHAWKGEGQACRSCGHLRRVKSFRFTGPCPNCGHE